MQLRVYTIDDLFEIGKAIIRNDTGVSYPFRRRTLHRALLYVASLFGSDASIQTIRLAHGMTIEGLEGTLLERKGLEYDTPRRERTYARLTGRFIPIVSPAPADYTAPQDTLVLRSATVTQSAIEFPTEAAAVIPSGGTQSNLVSAVCSQAGIAGNSIALGTSLALKYPIAGISHFLTETDSGGGFEEQEDADYRTDIREAKRGNHEATWSGITRLLKTVKLDSGHRVIAAKVFEDFTSGLVWGIIDDGSGLLATVGPIDSTTYAYGGFPAATYYEKTFSAANIDIQLPDCHLPYWNTGVDSDIRYYDASAGTWATLIYNTDYFVDIDTGHVVFGFMTDVGDIVRIWYLFYTGLVGEAAVYVNGIHGSLTFKGWRPVGQSVRIRGPYTLVQPTVSATLEFNSGFDSQFGRELAATYALTYLNSLDIGEAAEYGVMTHIIANAPGVKSVKNLLLNGGVIDVPATHPFGVVRGGGVISI